MAEIVKPQQFEFEEIEDSPKSDETSANLLMLALKALSQRALVALAACFSLLTVTSAFILWWSVLPNPTVYQLIGLGLYAVFILAIHLVARR